MARDLIVVEAKSTVRIRQGSCNYERVRDTACIFMQLTRQIKFTSSYSTQGEEKRFRPALALSDGSSRDTLCSARRRCGLLFLLGKLPFAKYRINHRRLRLRRYRRRIFPCRNYVALNSSASPAPFDGSRYPTLFTPGISSVLKTTASPARSVASCCCWNLVNDIARFRSRDARKLSNLWYMLKRLLEPYFYGIYDSYGSPPPSPPLPPPPPLPLLLLLPLRMCPPFACLFFFAISFA